MKIEKFSEFCERWTEENIDLCSCYHRENPPCTFCETSPYYQNKMIGEYDEYIKRINQNLGRILGDKDEHRTIHIFVKDGGKVVLNQE